MQLFTYVLTVFPGLQNNAAGAFLEYLFYFSRFMLPIAAIAIILRCGRSMLRERYEPEIWGYIDVPNGARVPLRSWECTIGSSAACDVTVGGKGVLSPHLVLTRNVYGRWHVDNLGPDGSARINDKPINHEDSFFLEDSDILELEGSELCFYNLTKSERREIARRRTSPGRMIAPGAMFGYITVFQLILLFQNFLTAKEEHKTSIALAFLALFAMMWIYFIFMRVGQRKGLEIEALAFFLSTIGLSVVATCSPDTMLKQISLLIAGIAAFLILGFWLRDLERVKKMSTPAAVAACLLLFTNLLFGIEQFGAKNWMSIAGYMFQPSELVKIAYIYAGAATLDRLYLKKNLLLYIAFSAICVGALALMGDFGTALIFFATFLVISFLRSGNFATILFAVTGAGLAGILAISAKPYIADRFALWGNAWKDINGAGFQQTRGMSAAASGGLFGNGAGNGWLKNIVAAETDLVFELAHEELGLIVCLCAVAAVIIMAVFAVKNAAQARSSFYVITGIGAISLMLVQLALNVFGSLDLLPFTGVTFPFVSMGGSSLISCWMMLAFIKATDTRKNSSFVVKSPVHIRDKNEFTAGAYNASEEFEYDDEKQGVDEMFLAEADEETPKKRNIFNRRSERRGRK